MAPEQARNGREVTGSADVFSLGCVLFECLTGQRAFAGEWVMEVLTKILQSEPPRVSKLRDNVPRELDDLVARMLQKRPEDRPALSAVIAALEPLRTLTHDTTPKLPGFSGEAAALRAPVGNSERRLTGYVLADDREGGLSGESYPTISVEGAESAAQLLGQAVFAVGGQLGATASGEPLVTLLSTGVAVDLAARTARCALALRRVLPTARIAVALGSAEPGAAVGIGEGVERAEKILAEHRDSLTPPILLDAVVSGLLDGRFDVGGSSGQILRSERPFATARRELLGKPAPFVGRERELALLNAVIDECLDEPLASVVLLTGGVRIGKSRLLRECIEARQRSPHAATLESPLEVWTAHAEPLLSPRPLALLAQLLCNMAGISDDDPLGVRHKKLEQRLRRRLTAQSAARVGKELAPLLSAYDESLTISELPPKEAPSIDRVSHAVAELLDAETAAGPLAIVLDDLQWSDAPSVRLFGNAMRILQQRPLLLLAAARPEIHDLFPKLWAERHAREVRLAALTPSAARRLLVDVLGERFDRAAADSLLDAAGGNPFHIEEFLRAGARGEVAPAPLTIAAQAGLEQLESEQRRVLRAASIFGPTFYLGGVLSLLEAAGDGPVRAAIDALVQQELLVRLPESRIEGQEQLAFRRTTVHRAAYNMLTGTDRRAGHKRAAEWLEANGARDAMALAEHLERADEPQGAIVWYLWAAEQALEADDLGAVLSRAERGVSCGAQGPMLGELRVLEAEATEWTGRGNEALLAKEALSLLSPRTAAYCRAGAVMAVSSLRSGGGAMQSELLALPIDRTVGIGHAVAMARVAVELLFAGRPFDAERFAKWVGQIAPTAYEEDLPTLKILSGWLAAARSLFAGRPDAMLQKAGAVSEALREVGQVRLCSAVALHASIACAALFDYEAGLKWASEAATIARRAGRGPWTRRTELLFAIHLFRLGRIDEARAAAARSIDGTAASNVAAATHARTQRTAILFAAGIRDDADRELRTTLWPPDGVPE